MMTLVLDKERGLKTLLDIVVFPYLSTLRGHFKRDCSTVSYTVSLDGTDLAARINQTEGKLTSAERWLLRRVLRMQLHAANSKQLLRCRYAPATQRPLREQVALERNRCLGFSFCFLWPAPNPPLGRPADFVSRTLSLASLSCSSHPPPYVDPRMSNESFRGGSRVRSSSGSSKLCDERAELRH